MGRRPKKGEKWDTINIDLENIDQFDFPLPLELLESSVEELKPIINRNIAYQRKLFLGTNGAGYKDKSLFVETNSTPVSTPIYWLNFPSPNYGEKYEKFKDVPSLKECFIKFGDISGRVFAEYFLGGVKHLEHLLTFAWFKDYFYELQNELYYLIRGAALKGLLEIAADKSHKNNFQALQLLVSDKWATGMLNDDFFKNLSKREKEAITDEIKKEQRRVLEDLKRISEESVTVN